MQLEGLGKVVVHGGERRTPCQASLRRSHLGWQPGGEQVSESAKFAKKKLCIVNLSSGVEKLLLIGVAKSATPGVIFVCLPFLLS